MSAVVAASMTLLLVLILVSQVGAQEDYVDVTFKLRVDGDVPADTAFVISHENLPFRGGSSPLPYFFCGVDSPPPALTGPATCDGGTVYTWIISKVKGATIEFDFSYLGPDYGDDKSLFTDVVTLNTDRTFTAYYRFPGGGDTQGDEQDEDDMPSHLPATGAGGTYGP